MLQSVPVNENLSSASYEPGLHWMLGGIQRDNNRAHLPKLLWGSFNLSPAVSAPTSLFTCACWTEPQAFILLVLSLPFLRLPLCLEFSSQLQISGILKDILSPSLLDALCRFPSSEGKLLQRK